MKTFAQLPISQPLIQVTRELGFTHLTPVQEQAIPILLQGKDLIGQSKTGSGKTLAYTLPILQNLDMGQARTLQALILCPTRELCTQVAREMRKLGRRHPGLQVLIMSGGQPLGPQARAIEKGVQIAVATPGRMLDHLGRGTLDLASIKTLVLDEADRMLDMGFQDEMEAILERLPVRRQTILFSATFPAEIQRVSRKYQSNPVQVTIETNEAEGTSPQIIQSVALAESQEEKFDVLLACLAAMKPKNVLIFCNLKVNVAQVANDLFDLGLPCGALHGDLEQRDRDQIMALFKNHTYPFLVATDVAARGIDVADLDLVINYDLPAQKETYVHRIGRTGRAAKSGHAITLITPPQAKKLALFEEELGLKLEPVALDAQAGLTLKELAAKATPPVLMQTITIYGGRKDKVRPGDILGALTGESGGFAAAQIGKIEIHDLFSYVAVSQDISKLAYKCLQNGTIKGRKFKVELIR